MPEDTGDTPAPPKKRARKKKDATTGAGGGEESSGAGDLSPEEMDAIRRADADRLAAQGHHAEAQAIIDEITDPASGDVNADRLASAMRDALTREAQADDALLSRIATDLPRLRAERDRLREERAGIEAGEAARARTPLALELIVTGCEFATVHFPAPEEDRTLPTFTMHHPCVLPGAARKDSPDNDCRFCVHHTRMSYGATLPVHQKRYPRAGMVIPIRDDTEADALAYFLRRMGMLQLRHVDHELASIEGLIEQGERAQQEVAMRALERRQRGPWMQ